MPKPKKPAVWRNRGYHGEIVNTEPADGGTLITLRDGHQVLIEDTDADILVAANSYDVRLRGEWVAHRNGGRWYIARCGADVDTFENCGGSRKPLTFSNPALEFTDFDALLQWGRHNNIAPNGFTTDIFGSWVPVGYRFAVDNTAHTPCTTPAFMSACERPATGDDGLCNMHRSHVERNTARNTARQERTQSLREQANERQRQHQVADMYAAKIRDELNVSCDSDNGTVTFNGEALYGMLTDICGVIGEDMWDELIPAPLRHQP